MGAIELTGEKIRWSYRVAGIVDDIRPSFRLLLMSLTESSDQRVIAVEDSDTAVQLGDEKEITGRGDTRRARQDASSYVAEVVPSKPEDGDSSISPISHVEFRRRPSTIDDDIMWRVEDHSTLRAVQGREEVAVTGEAVKETLAVSVSNPDLSGAAKALLVDRNGARAPRVPLVCFVLRSGDLALDRSVVEADEQDSPLPDEIAISGLVRRVLVTVVSNPDGFFAAILNDSQVVYLGETGLKLRPQPTVIVEKRECRPVRPREQHRAIVQNCDPVVCPSVARCAWERDLFPTVDNASDYDLRQ